MKLTAGQILNIHNSIIKLIRDETISASLVLDIKQLLTPEILDLVKSVDEIRQSLQAKMIFDEDKKCTNETLLNAEFGEMLLKEIEVKPFKKVTINLSLPENKLIKCNDVHQEIIKDFIGFTK